MSGRCAKCASQGGHREPCTVAGCDRPQRGHKAGLCNMHRQRARKHGDPLHSRFPSLLERLQSRLDKSGECWIWTGVLSDGYGQVWSEGKMRGAHRLIYEALRGPIPDGLVIDHLCRNPACCNPEHLEPVTQAENVRRGLHGVLRGKTNAA